MVGCFDRQTEWRLRYIAEAEMVSTAGDNYERVERLGDGRPAGHQP